MVKALSDDKKKEIPTLNSNQENKDLFNVREMLNENESRLSVDEYFIAIARIVAQRSTCLRRKVGAVLVRDKQILSTGYNGAPSGIPHCTKERCLRLKNNTESGKSLDLCYAVHAEANAIIQAALHGTDISGETTLYVTAFPCISCLKMILNAKIQKIVFLEEYKEENPIKLQLIKESGIKCVHFTPNEKKMKTLRDYF
jgi:dCMP deaminase